MSLLAIRVLLVFLLGVDWYADPPAGLSPTGRAMASTDVVYHSLGKGKVTDPLAARPLLIADHPQPLDLGSIPEDWRPGELPATVRGRTDLIYVFMSLRR
jgi:hypothetical protein